MRKNLLVINFSDFQPESQRNLWPTSFFAFFCFVCLKAAQAIITRRPIRTFHDAFFFKFFYFWFNFSVRKRNSTQRTLKTSYLWKLLCNYKLFLENKQKKNYKNIKKTNQKYKYIKKLITVIIRTKIMPLTQ